MSSIRNVFWRGAFALALLPVSACLVAANGPGSVAPKANWKYQFSEADARDRALEQQRMIARQISAAQVQELRVMAATLRARQQESRAKFVTFVEFQRAAAAQPSG